MNINKILCKYLDIDKKGYVNGFDFIFFGIMILASITLLLFISAFLGEIVKVDILNNGEYKTSILGVFSPSNIYLGFLTLIPSISIILIGYKTIDNVCKLIMKFSKHKFIICKNNRLIEDKLNKLL